MKLLCIFIALVLGANTTCAREKITKIGTATSEVRAGEFSEWFAVTVFYNKKAHLLSIKPGSKVDILRDYIGAISREDPQKLIITVSSIEDTDGDADSAIRDRRINRRIRTLTATELNKTIEETEASVFTIKKLEED